GDSTIEPSSHPTDRPDERDSNLSIWFLHQRTRAPETLPAAHGGRQRHALATGSVVVVLDQLFVLVGIEQLVELGTVAGANEKNPATPESILVDRLGLVVEQFIDLDDFAGNRRVDVR